MLQNKFEVNVLKKKYHLQNTLYSQTDSIETSFKDEYISNKTDSLLPIGVFWDIENCQVPKGCSALSIVQFVRETYYTGYREAEFVVVCDVSKEQNQIIQELLDAQVTVIHVASMAKNAVDEKLRQVLRRFTETYNAPAAVILISSDINFAADLTDIKHRKKMHVILIHKENTSKALLMCSSEHYNFSSIAENLLVEEDDTDVDKSTLEILVTNLPLAYTNTKLRKRLKQLSFNCGGKITFVSSKNGTAILRFGSSDFASRAQKRMDGEDVYGNKISVSYPNPIRSLHKAYSPYKFPGNRVTKKSKLHLHSNYELPSVSSASSSPSPYSSKDNILQAVTIIGQENLDDTIHMQDYDCFGSEDQFNMQETMSSMRALENRSNRNQYSNGLNHFDYCMSNQRGSQNTALNENSNKSTWFSNNSSYSSLNAENSESRNNYKTKSTFSQSSDSPGPVELSITNLDQTLCKHELRSILLSMLKEYVTVSNLSLMYQYDGTVVATVRLSSVEEAQFVISQLHRRKVGQKRILISNNQTTTTTNTQVLKQQIICLLQEVPGNQMPLFKFRELLETRYRYSVSLSELYKLRDVCLISDELGGRIITLNSEFRTLSSANSILNCDLEMPYCIIHCPRGFGERGWAESEIPTLPNVRFQLADFTSKVHHLLKSHLGALPLQSIPMCYEAEIKELLPIDPSGVPMEHLLTCVSGITIYLSQKNLVKYVMQDYLTETSSTRSVTPTVSSTTTGLKGVSSPVASQLSLFSRELVDLMKTIPHCQLPFSKFIPAYHHHFGRQCRVADYGHTKLVDLFESVSHIVQIMGEGNSRIITLTHFAQIRRFTSDLLRVLKTQVLKQVLLSEFNSAYEKALGRPFDPVDYGLCEVTDLLNAVSENTIMMKQCGNDLIIAIPKREQTPDEIFKTKQFSYEVVELLRHAPQYSLLFNKFVPAYHHHFGHQCRVADYGFNKLIELFEVIPEVVKIEETSTGERTVSLCAKEALKVLNQQIVQLINSSTLKYVSMSSLPSMFLREYGYALRAELYESHSMSDVMCKLCELQCISMSEGLITLVNEDTLKNNLGIRIWSLLIQPPHMLPVSILVQNFETQFEYPCTMAQLQMLTSMLKIKINNNETIVSLTPEYILAAHIYNLLYENGGSVLIGNIDALYLRKYGKVLRPMDFDISSLSRFFTQFSNIFIVKGKRNKRVAHINWNLSRLGVLIPEQIHCVTAHDSNDNNIHWPPPPPHTFLSSRAPISPPKPDTPPTYGNFDNSLWSPPTVTSTYVSNLCIPMPSIQTPPLSETFGELISPMKSLLPAYSPDEFVRPPHPNKLPKPTAEFLNRCNSTGNISPGIDSGIDYDSTSVCNSEEPDAKPGLNLNL